MKENYKNKAVFFIITIIFIIISASFVSANEKTSSQRLFDLEVQLLELIQTSRFDHNNLPPLNLDDRLSTSADLHAQEMVKYCYLSSTSLNGDTIYDRIIKTGYYPIISGQAMAAILFNNFVPPDQAITSLHNNLISNEQDDELKIFSPDFVDIGVSIRSGTISIDDRIYNFYIAVCDLGTEELSTAEKDAFYLINSLVPKKLDMDLRIIAEEAFAPFAQKIVDSLLSYNESITDAAELGAENLIEEKEVDTVYSGCAVNKNIGYLIFSSTDPAFLNYSNISDDNAVILMERMIENESNILLYNRTLLNYQYKDIGLVFKTMFINNLEGNDYCLQALIVVSGKADADCY